MIPLKILLLGATGFLGTYLDRHLRQSGHTVFRVSRGVEEQGICIDCTNKLDMRNLIKITSPEIIFNLIAYTDVDGCELAPEAAKRLNVLPATILADELMVNDSIHLIHISTDQVYSGNGPHREEFTSPCNVYGSTKLAAENELKEIKATIFRTNFLGKSANKNRHSLTDWYVSSLKEKKNIELFDDIKFSPLHISTLCKFLEYSMYQKLPGVFNIGSVGSMTKASLLLNLSKLIGLDSSFVKISKADTANRFAKRPLDMSLNSDKFNEFFKLELPTISQTIDLLAKDYYEYRSAD